MALAKTLLSQFGSIGPYGKRWIVGPDVRAWYQGAADEDYLAGAKETREDSASPALVAFSPSLLLLPPTRLPGKGQPNNSESIFRQPRHPVTSTTPPQTKEGANALNVVLVFAKLSDRGHAYAVEMQGRSLRRSRNGRYEFKPSERAQEARDRLMVSLYKTLEHCRR